MTSNNTDPDSNLQDYKEMLEEMKKLRFASSKLRRKHFMINLQ